MSRRISRERHPSAPDAPPRLRVFDLLVGHSGPITLGDRQGVYAHSFKCGTCGLEFVLFSWRADRHGVGTVFCPECGRKGPMLHYRAILSEDTEFSPFSADEIFRLWPWKGSELLDDTRMERPDVTPPEPSAPDHRRTDHRRSGEQASG